MMMRPLRPVPLLIALVWHYIHSYIIQRIVDVDRGCHGLALSSHPLPPARPTATAQTQSSSSFESSALSWLKREGHAPAAPTPPSPFLPTQLLAAGGSPTSSDDAASWTDRIRRSTKYKPGRVKRVVDASTIQLERGGYVSLADVRGAGGTYRLPDCMDRSPSYRLKQLLPAGTAVRLIDPSDAMPSEGEPSSSSSPPSTPRVWIVRDKDEVIVNRELVGSGFAFVRRGSGSPSAVTDDLLRLERDAKEAGRGIFKSCSANADETSASDTTDGGAVPTSGFVAEFEPLDYTTEIRYGDDGGKQVVVARRDDAASPPANPGDVKGCSDFDTYEEALGWYEAYLPYYGDVAKLDRDGDGVPCPGLPHTSVGEKYRMKVPKKSVPKQ